MDFLAGACRLTSRHDLRSGRSALHPFRRDVSRLFGAGPDNEMNKPLSVEERTLIEAAIARTSNQWDGGHRELKLAMQAEGYWLHAVRGVDPIEGGNDGDADYCVFCGPGYHKPDCAWLQAQASQPTTQPQQSSTASPDPQGSDSQT